MTTPAGDNPGVDGRAGQQPGRWRGKAGDALVETALARERSATTGFGKGVAVPHAKDAVVSRPTAALGVSENGIDFKAVDGRPVFVVALLLSPAEAEAHLAAMNALWPVLGDAARRRALRQAATRERVGRRAYSANQPDPEGGTGVKLRTRNPRQQRPRPARPAGHAGRRRRQRLFVRPNPHQAGRRGREGSRPSPTPRA